LIQTTLRVVKINSLIFCFFFGVTDAIDNNLLDRRFIETVETGEWKMTCSPDSKIDDL
jgi:hypothetical protein